MASGLLSCQEGELVTHDLIHVRFPKGMSERETVAVVNMVALAIFVAVELAFSYFAFPTPWAMLLVAAAGLLYRACEALLARKRPLLAASHSRLWTVVSVVAGLVLPFALAAATRQFHTHYFGLLILPVLEGALNFSLPITLGIAGLASVSAFVWVAYAAHFRVPFQLGELLEATTLTLLLFTVAGLVWTLLHLIADRDAELRSRVKELKDAQARLLEEEKLAAIGRLASAVAHEIRNPVAIIRSAVEASATLPADCAEHETMAGIALTEAKRLEKLTTDFLSYAKPGSPLCREVDVDTLLGYIASLARAQARSKQVDVSLVVGDGCALFGNEDQLQQAMLNLIRNAVDASPEGGTVLICCETEAAALKISVENTGEAIPAEAAPKIFEPFFSAKAGGTGLGLSIARKIIEGHGGTLNLAANRTDCIRFDVLLPARPPDASGATGGRR